jgi:hypothetical protein
MRRPEGPLRPRPPRRRTHRLSHTHLCTGRGRRSAVKADFAAARWKEGYSSSEEASAAVRDCLYPPGMSGNTGSRRRPAESLASHKEHDAIKRCPGANRNLQGTNRTERASTEVETLCELSGSCETCWQKPGEAQQAYLRQSWASYTPLTPQQHHRQAGMAPADSPGVRGGQ